MKDRERIMFSFKKFVAGINEGADIESAMTVAASTISLDQFIDDNVVGSSFKDLMNKDTFMSLYSMNKHGIGTREPASYFMDSLTTFFNPLLKPDRSGKRPRPEETPEFAEKYNKAEYDELDKLRRQVLKKKMLAYKNKDEEAKEAAEAENKRLTELISQTEFQIARQKASTSTEQLVSDMFNTPIDKRDVEELKADYPNQYADLEQAYSNIAQSTN